MDEERMRRTDERIAAIAESLELGGMQQENELAIIEQADGTRITVRILGKEPADRVRIGENVKFAEARNGVLYYKKANGSSAPELPESPRPLV